MFRSIKGYAIFFYSFSNKVYFVLLILDRYCVFILAVWLCVSSHAAVLSMIVVTCYIIQSACMIILLAYLMYSD